MSNSEMYRILVVDDLMENLLVLQTILELEGYTVELAESGKVALTKIGESPPDLILLDVMMPDLSGYEVTRQIRENPNLPFIPIILLTAHDKVDAAQWLDSGANDFIPKGIEIDELLDKIQKFLKLKSN